MYDPIFNTYPILVIIVWEARRYFEWQKCQTAWSPSFLPYLFEPPIPHRIYDARYFSGDPRMYAMANDGPFYSLAVYFLIM